MAQALSPRGCRFLGVSMIAPPHGLAIADAIDIPSSAFQKCRRDRVGSGGSGAGAAVEDCACGALSTFRLDRLAHILRRSA